MINVIYVVHSDVDENNIYAEFDFKDEALAYAKEHAPEDKVWVEAVELERNDFGEVIEVFDKATVWSWEDEVKSSEDQHAETFDMTDLADENKPAAKNVDEDLLIAVKEVPDAFDKIDWVDDEINCCAGGSCECEAPEEEAEWPDPTADISIVAEPAAVRDALSDAIMAEFVPAEEVPTEAQAEVEEPKEEQPEDVEVSAEIVAEPAEADSVEETENSEDSDSDSEDSLPPEFESETKATLEEDVEDEVEDEEAAAAEDSADAEADEIPDTLVGILDYLSWDEEEAIEGYDKAIDKVEDEHVKDQLEHIKDEEEAHKEYLDAAQEDPTVEYEHAEEESDEGSDESEEASEVAEEDAAAEDAVEESLAEDVAEKEFKIEYTTLVQEEPVEAVISAVNKDKALEQLEANIAAAEISPDVLDDLGIAEDELNTVINITEVNNECLEEHVQDRPAPVESEQKLQGMDNAVVDCETDYKVIAHSEDEKPLDCKMEKPALEEPLAGEKVDVKINEEVLNPDAHLGSLEKYLKDSEDVLARAKEIDAGDEVIKALEKKVESRKKDIEDYKAWLASEPKSEE